MANDTAGQLARIRAKAEGMGLSFGEYDEEKKLEQLSDYYLTDYDKFALNFDDLDTAESLLAVLDPDAFVVGVMSPSYWGEILNCKVPVCNHHCELYNCGGCGEDEQPDSRCPGPAPDDHEWVMVGRRKVKVDKDADG